MLCPPRAMQVFIRAVGIFRSQGGGGQHSGLDVLYCTEYLRAIGVFVLDHQNGDRSEGRRGRLWRPLVDMQRPILEG